MRWEVALVFGADDDDSIEVARVNSRGAPIHAQKRPCRGGNTGG